MIEVALHTQQLPCQKATTLDLSCNVLTVLPPTFPTLTQLTRLDLSKNNLTELPSDFGRLVNLERLDLFSNKLEDLPISCAHLKKLKWLDLKRNPIETSLPDVVGNCLSAAECKECANNMISYLKVKNAEQERKRQKKLKDEREKNALKAANIAKEKELRKRQKLLEKQQKREAYEALEKEKKLLAQESEQDPEAVPVWSTLTSQNRELLHQKPHSLSVSSKLMSGGFAQSLASAHI